MANTAEWEPTEKQKEIIDAEGDTIVSASAGSGKTTVMIERLVQKIIKSASSADEDESSEDRVSLENVLAVTFTNAAAENMRDKLRARLGDEIAKTSKTIDDLSEEIKKEGESAERSKKEELERLTKLRDRLTDQYDLIPSADISTIHSFCLNLIKKYFYLTDRDANSEILDDKGSEAAVLRERAFDNLFNGPRGETGYYGIQGKAGKLQNESFSVLLKYLRNGRKDDGIKECMMDAYGKVRNIARYREKLAEWRDSYTEEGFKKVCEEIKRSDGKLLDECLDIAAAQEPLFAAVSGEDDYGVAAGYSERFCAIKEFLNEQKGKGICEHPQDAVLPKAVLIGDYKGADKKRLDADKGEKERIKKLSSDFNEDVLKPIKEKYKAVAGGRRSYEEELSVYLKAGEIASALCQCLLDFDDEYSKVKNDEHKLDYSDLEQIALDLLKNHEDVIADLNERYKLIFVDEFQDVNPAQKEILFSLGNEKFFVGDIKQAIYAFRGSDSGFFSKTYAEFKEGGKNAINLSRNFRSSDGIINRVNDVFGVSMTEEVYDISYNKDGHRMEGSGSAERSGAQVYYFETGASENDIQAGIYSVKDSASKAKNDAGEKAVARLIKRYLHPKQGKAYSEGDICVLARKGKRVRAIAKKLEEEGISISGTEGGNILDNSEIRQIVDMLSYIDDGEQDLPMTSAMLSPLGNFTEDELAAIRVDDRAAKTYRECVKNYERRHKNDGDEARKGIAEKIIAFEARTKDLKEASRILSAGAMIDKIMRDTGMELRYSQYPERLKAVSMLAAQGEDKTLSAFLKDVTAKGATINMPASAASDGVKIMTMHSAKGLEFPVVIICNAAEQYGGRSEYTYLFDDEWGFAFKYHNDADMTKSDTLLWKVVEDKKSREEIKDELNLFYVACTRARERLDIVTAKEPADYDIAKAQKGGNYAAIVDLKSFGNALPLYLDEEDDWEGEETGQKDKNAGLEEGDEDEFGGLGAEDTVSSENVLSEAEGDDFERRYRGVLDMTYKFNYMNAPAKTSVTDAIKKDDVTREITDDDDEEKLDENERDEEDVGSEPRRADGAKRRDVGTAYHKFLELCDIDVRDAEGIEREIEDLFASGSLMEEQRDILRNDMRTKDASGPVEAVERVYEKVHSKGTPAAMYRERRFICNLPAGDVYLDKYREGKIVEKGEDFVDDVLVQGVIDLLVRYDGGEWYIIDYKYSEKGKEELYKTYERQLDLYKAAAAKILDIDEKKIDTTLVNINPGMNA